MADKSERVGEYIILFSLMLFFVLLLLDTIIPEREESRYMKLFRINCCNGGYCTDTYYEEETNRCYFTLSSLFGRQWYEGKNITLE